MWGRSFGPGVGGLGLPFGAGGLPPPRSSSVDGGAGAEEQFLKPEASAPSEKWKFPLNAGLTSGGLAVIGDAAAQFYSRFEATKQLRPLASRKNVLTDESFWQHDWVRSLRMGSYGFLLYGPLSHCWYQWLDQLLPTKTLQNFSIKVLLNQVVLGPIVIAIVFAWNCAWQGRFDVLPDLYRHKALNTLVDGWKFWTPVSFLNFGVVPLEARVGFMSTCAICWNFYISSVVSKKAA